MYRVSATQLESFRLWSDPEQEWMTEEELVASIRGEFVENHKIALGSAFGKVLETPARYAVTNSRGDLIGYHVRTNRETFDFGADMMAEPLALIDRAAGVFEAKAVKSYGPIDVASKADFLVGGQLVEFKTTLSTFDVDKYAESSQWRFMADAMQPLDVTYHVFCLAEATNGVIDLKSIETVRFYPYPALHQDCADLVDRFRCYVEAKGLTGVLRTRYEGAA